MEKLFTLLGLGAPFGLATATYAVFWWLDINASDEATNVISSWLQGRSQNKPDLGNLIISAFDRVYTSPLLRFRAFRRSAIISSTIWLVVFLVPSLVTTGPLMLTYPDLIYIKLTEYIALWFIIVLTDYISLLVCTEESLILL